MSRNGRFAVVAIDLDGTLLRGTTASLLLATHLGREDGLRELEARFARGEISNAEIADLTAPSFVGRTAEELWPPLAEAAWIGGIEETVAELRGMGLAVYLSTISWTFAAELVRERYGFDAACGTELERDGARLGGRVVRHFDEHDKVRFVADCCRTRGVGLGAAVAIGDSRSDVPLFRECGLAIAVNATPAAREAADAALETDDLRDVLPLIAAG